LTENNLVNIGYEGSENVNKIYNKIKKNNIEKINKNYILNSGKNNINNDNNDIIKYISDKFIKKYKIYKNLLDFYISHFIDFNINIDLLISNLNFYSVININTDEKINFQKKFSFLLQSLSLDELKLFNLCISGSYINQSKYIIQIEHSNINRLPIFHTCFNKMDIYNYKNFEQKYLKIENNIINDSCKKNFIELLNIAIKSGFQLS